MKFSTILISFGLLISACGSSPISEGIDDKKIKVTPTIEVIPHTPTARVVLIATPKPSSTPQPATPLTYNGGELDSSYLFVKARLSYYFIDTQTSNLIVIPENYINSVNQSLFWRTEDDTFTLSPLSEWAVEDGHVFSFGRFYFQHGWEIAKGKYVINIQGNYASNNMAMAVFDLSGKLIEEQIIVGVFEFVDVSFDGKYILLLQTMPREDYVYRSEMFVYDWQKNTLIQITDDVPGQIDGKWSNTDYSVALISSVYAITGGDGPLYGDDLSIYNGETGTLQYSFGNIALPDSEYELKFAQLKWSRDDLVIAFMDWQKMHNEGSNICILTLATQKIECPTMKHEELVSQLNLWPIFDSDRLFFVSSDERGCQRAMVYDLETDSFSVLNAICIAKGIYGILP